MFARIQKTIQAFAGYWKELLHDIDGFPSSKRLGFLISCVVVVASWFVNVIWHYVVDHTIINAALGLGGVSGAGIAGERFGKIIGDSTAPPPAAKPVPPGLKND